MCVLHVEEAADSTNRSVTLLARRAIRRTVHVLG